MALVALAALSLGVAPANAWYQNDLPPGCVFTANPQKPYLSGGRIYSKVSFTIKGCDGNLFWRTHAIAEASSPESAYPYHRTDVRGVVPNTTSITTSMPCKAGNWATTLSLDFDVPGYGFAQSSVLSVASC